MAIPDAERHRSHTRLDQVAGEEEAAIPPSPSGWSDIVRTPDLDQVEARFDVELEAIEAQFEATLERRLRERSERCFVATGAVLTIATTLQAAVGELLG